MIPWEEHLLLGFERSQDGPREPSSRPTQLIRVKEKTGIQKPSPPQTLGVHFVGAALCLISKFKKKKKQSGKV